MPIYKKGSEGAELERKPRLTRLGIIRLGTLETGEKDGREYTYPHASNHFELRSAPEVAQVYSPNGEEVTVLDPIIIPVEDEDAVAAHYFRMYGGSHAGSPGRLLCKGDNNKASRRVDADRLKATGETEPAAWDAKNTVWKEISCPCDFLGKECRESLYFRFVLPDVPGIGVWQLRTTSYQSIEQLQGCISLVRAIAGHVAGIPLKLSLEPKTTYSQGRGGEVTNYILKLEVSGSVTIPQLAAMGEKRAALPAPGPGVKIDADYDDEEFDDPELQEFTSNQAPDELTEANFEQPPADESPAAPASPANTAPAKGRAHSQRQRQGRQNQPVGPPPMDELKSDRQALSQLIKDTVPSDHLDNVADDLAGWFKGKNRITQLTIDELKRAGPLFQEKYAQEPAPPQ